MVRNNATDRLQETAPTLLHSRAKERNGLKAFLKNQETIRTNQQKQQMSPYGPHDDDESSESSIDLIDVTRIDRPCYRDSYNDGMNDSISSFTSHTMLHEESPTTRRQRQNRLEKMRADREMLAKMEEQNMTLEEETRKKAANNPLNSFLNGARKRAQAFGPAEDSESPLPRPKSSAQKLLKNLNKITMPVIGRRHDAQRIEQMHSSEPSLPSTRDLTGEDEHESVLGLAAAKANIESGRDRPRTRTARRDRRMRQHNVRSLSPAGGRKARARPGISTTRIRQSPVIQEVQW